MSNEEINDLVNRHLARCLSDLDDMKVADVIKRVVKRYFYFLADDIKNGKSKEEKNDRVRQNS